MSQSGIPPPSAALFGGAKKSLVKSAAAPWALAFAALALGVVMIRIGGSESEKAGAAARGASDAVASRLQSEAESTVNRGLNSATTALTARPK